MDNHIRLVLAIIRQAVLDARHPVIWDSEGQYRPRLEEELRREAIAWLLESDLIDLCCETWGITREELVRRLENYD